MHSRSLSAISVSQAITPTPSIAIGKVVHGRQGPAMRAVAEMVSASSDCRVQVIIEAKAL